MKMRRNVALQTLFLLQLISFHAALSSAARTGRGTGAPSLAPSRTPSFSPQGAPTPTPSFSPQGAPTPAPAIPPTTAATPYSPSSPGRIDTHTHFVPTWYKQLVDSRNLTAGGFPFPVWNATAHLEVNAQFGIQTSVVSASTPGAKLSEDAPIEEGRQIARLLNEYGKNLTEQYPGQFLYFASLTLPDLEGAIEEAIYAFDNLKAAGVIVEANAFGELFGTTRYAPLYKELNDRNATVFIHPSNSPCSGDSTNATTDPNEIPAYVIDFLLDTSRAALNLVYQNITTNYPNINFILAHSGGFLPFAATRAAGGLTVLSGLRSTEVQRTYLNELNKFHVDLALSATPTALPSTTAFFATNRITFGSDYPFSPVTGVAQNTDAYESFQFSSGALTAQARGLIDYQNAYSLLSKYLS